MTTVKNFHNDFAPDARYHSYKDIRILAEPIEREAGGGFNLVAEVGPRVWAVSVRNLSAARQLFDELAGGFHGSWELLSGPDPGPAKRVKKPMSDRKKTAAQRKQPRRSVDWHLRQLRK